MNIAIIGFGYWGPNLARNFGTTKGVFVAAVCDRNPESLKRAATSWPQAAMVDDYRTLLARNDIDAVAISTPVSTHFEIARAALEAGKHVFVEKPFTATAAQAEMLIELAVKRNLRIMVDHTFLFTGAVRKIKELIDRNELGNIYYFDSIRVNLGLFQPDVDVIWDLAPHDFAVLDHLIGERPTAIAAHGIDHFGRGLVDIAYITIYFGNRIAHVSVNWISPVKVRTTLIGGDRKMLVWNDLESDEKIKVYDRGVDITSAESKYNLLVSYRSGDMSAPRLPNIEALKLEAEYFAECVQNNITPFNDGAAGLRIVRLLEACSQSLAHEGKLVKL